MPQLKQLSCSIQWAGTGALFPEYGTVYGDGLVETFIVIPDKPQLFTIRLKSLKFVHEGLAMIAFIDGNYQANRNRVNLRPQKKNMPVNRTQVDFLLRQREKPIGDGVYMGREWRFDNHNIVEDLPEGVKESHFDLLGTIEVLVLRCRARVPEEIDESDSSSAADSDALGEKEERAVIDDDEDDEEGDNRASNTDDPTEAGHTRAEPADEQLEDIFGALLFGADATNDARTICGPSHLMSGVPGNAGPAPWLAVDPSGNRNALPTKPANHYNPQYQRSFSGHNQTHQPQQQHAEPPRKHVRFSTNMQPQTARSSMPPPLPTKPAAYKVKQTTSRPLYQSHQPNYGPPINNVNQHSNDQSTQFQQQLPPSASTTAPNFQTIPRSVSLPSWGPPPPSMHYLQPQYRHQPHILTGNAFPYYQHIWPAQPPHIVYNPYQLHPSGHWPNVPAPNSNPGAATGASASKNSNTDTSNQQQSPNSGSNNWESQNDSSNAAPNSTPDWNDSQDQNNASSSWNNDTPVEPQNNADDREWSNSQTENNDNTQWNGIGDNGNNDNENQGNGGTSTDWRNAGTNNDSATNWPNTGSNDNDGNNNNWDQPNDPVTNDDNKGTLHNDLDTADTARALFGPHGQYYTYNPRGPDEPAPDAEEEPRYDVPKKVAAATGSTKQVVPGSGYTYWKKRRAPKYIDSMEEPYARFIFKYRTKDQLEKEIGIKIEVEPTGNEAIQELQSMDKQALIEMLIRAKSALGGKVPSPPLKPVALPGDQGILVPVEPPDQQFLRYKLPELRQAIVSAVEPSHSLPEGQNSSNGGNNGGSSALQDWSASSNNNNDTTWAQTNNNDTNWNVNDQSNQNNVDWHKCWDGAGERGTHTEKVNTNGGCNQSSVSKQNVTQQANRSTSQGSLRGNMTTRISNPPLAWNQTNNDMPPVPSSPSTLPLDQPYNPPGFEKPSPPPVPPAFNGNGQQVGIAPNEPPGADPNPNMKGQW